MLNLILVCIIVLLGLAAAWIADGLVTDAIKRWKANRLWGDCVVEAANEMPEAPAAMVLQMADRRYRKLAYERQLPIHLQGTRSGLLSHG